MKKLKKVFASLGLIIACVSLCSFFPLNFSVLKASAQETSEGVKALPFRDLSAEQIIQEMGVGWNLGNTMDGHINFMPSETAWQSDITTQKLIDAVHDLGFNTIRVPVTWGKKIDDNNNYKVDEAWISRVQDIVDYAVSQDMYVVVNMHHDGVHDGGGWFNLTKKDDELEKIKQKYSALWKQIAERFKYYDEHLLFESMNEVWVTNNNYPYDFQIIGEFNQIFVDTVRETGYNNRHRWLICPGRYTNLSALLDPANNFKLPEDKYNEENRIMVSVHDYDSNFGLSGTSSNFNNADQWRQNFKKMYDIFVSKGIPVFFGEHGATDVGNTTQRAYYFEWVYKLSQLAKVVACVWDNNGAYEPGKTADKFQIINRAACEPSRKEITDAIMRGYFVKSPQDSLDNIVSVESSNSRNSPNRPITNITLSNASLALKPGMSKKVTVTVEPENTNDVVLWKTSDPSVATVYNGFIRAKGVGRATITAFCQKSAVTKEITVTVYPDKDAKSATEIIVDKETFNLEPGKAETINVQLKPANTKEFVRFKSSNPDVATVNKLGKIVAVGEGAAYISITTASGLTKVVKAVVNGSSGKPATQITINGQSDVELTQEAQISVAVTPADTTDKIAFYSTDNSIAYVDITALSPDSEGNVSAKLVALGSGSAQVIVISESGVSKAFNITASIGSVTFDGEAEQYVKLAEYPEVDDGGGSEKGCKGCNKANNAVVLAIMAAALFAVTVFKK